MPVKIWKTMLESWHQELKSGVENTPSLILKHGFKTEILKRVWNTVFYIMLWNPWSKIFECEVDWPFALCRGFSCLFLFTAFFQRQESWFLFTFALVWTDFFLIIAHFAAAWRSWLYTKAYMTWPILWLKIKCLFIFKEGIHSRL